MFSFEHLRVKQISYFTYKTKRLFLNCKMLFFDAIDLGKSFQTLVPILFTMLKYQML